jgi:hypothetical protein
MSWSRAFHVPILLPDRMLRILRDVGDVRRDYDAQGAESPPLNRHRVAGGLAQNHKTAFRFFCKCPF